MSRNAASKKSFFLVGALCDIQETVVKETNVEAEINQNVKSVSRIPYSSG